MKNQRILVVDDEQVIRDMCKKALEWAGYLVDVCQNAHEALELVDKEEDYELVLTDLNLPGLNGLELIGEIKKKHPRCKTLLMTGTPPENNIDTRNCLHKPFGLTELVLRVKERLSSP
jgi:DNA-binding response OmpR family regulator